jgi:hypothetical protein
VALNQVPAMSDKKPVWVDESAHAILKQYSKLTKESMVDVASRLVIDHLDDLDPASGLGGAEPKAAAAAPRGGQASRPRAPGRGSCSASPAAEGRRQRPLPWRRLVHLNPTFLESP